MWHLFVSMPLLAPPISPTSPLTLLIILYSAAILYTADGFTTSHSEARLGPLP
jgi:hypothetical protein